MNTETVTRWMHACATSISEQRDYLTQLDAAIGDADHGANMTGGSPLSKPSWTASTAAPRRAGADAGRLDAGSTVGGASGPLWGSALRRAGKALGEAETFEAPTWSRRSTPRFTASSSSGRRSRGTRRSSTRSGPPCRRSARGVEAGRPLPDAVARRAGGRRGGHARTIPMQARKGRASYLGERSVGHQDPGATSTALIMAALERTVAEES